MKAPFFWYQPPGLFSTLLQPLGWLYAKGGRLLSVFKKPKSFQIPILSIGNIVSGGAGKTPTAIAFACLLKARGYEVHFVTRGYGGQEKGPLMVDVLNHKAKNVGDEPLLLAQYAPTWVAKKRSEGVQRAIENGAQLIILDDGHQTTSLHKDVSLVVVDLLQAFGNGRVIPAGPLREDLSQGIKRADGFIVIGEPIQSVSSLLHPAFCRVHNDIKPLFQAQLVPQPLILPSNRVIAFCGLGFPQKFYMSLKNMGLELVGTESFPDHYPYTNEDLLRLQQLAHKQQCILITTRKDLIKVPPSWQEKVYVLDITIEFEDPDKICSFILQKIHP